MRIVVIIPGYNEEKYLAETLRGVLKVTKDVIYVDDGSSDASVSIAKKHLHHVLVHETNLGKGAALKTGCEYAFSHLKADAVVFMDADNQHSASDLPRFFAEPKKGSSVVFGVRKFSSATPLMRFLGNKFASVLMSALYGRYIPDIPSGFKAMNKTAYKALVWNSAGYEVEMEIAVRVIQKKIPYAELEIEAIYHDNDKGMTAIDALHIAKSLLQWRIGL